ncbi:unnamed protein product [Rhizoctonia solani]|uniref:Uncharacterized protein n=1 Tax=Rhizoctonia solani TaxID=456999 RepID=A0A8H2XLR4_9AGAM|nr:unnamed protein product [Rhizoctonia solani]
MSSLFKGLFGVNVSVTSPSYHIPNEGSAPPPPGVFHGVNNDANQMPVEQADGQAPVANHNMGRFKSPGFGSYFLSIAISLTARGVCIVDATEDEWIGGEQEVSDDDDEAHQAIENDVAAGDVTSQL